MKPKIWLRSGEQIWLEPATDEKGTLNIYRIAERMNLLPQTLLFEELGAYEGTTIEDVRDACGLTVGQSKDSAVLVGGTAISPPKGDPPPKRSLEADAAATRSYFNELLEAPGELPCSVRDLSLFLAERRGKLPLFSESTYHAVADPELVTVLNNAREHKLAMFLESAFEVIQEIKQGPGNEAQSSHYLSYITGDFLKTLNRNAPTDKQLLGLETILDSANPSSSEAALLALEPLKRPDFQLFVSETLLLRWENKINPAERGDAMDENVEKLKVWSPLYYGELPFVIGGWCGGRLFQWLKLSPRGEKIHAEPISVVYDLSLMSGGALLLHSIIRMHCLLRKLQDKLTTFPPVRLYKRILRGDGGGSVTFYPAFVIKEVVPALISDRVEELQSLYDAIKGSTYLIKLRGKIRNLRSKTVLTLEPIGDRSAMPRDLEELRNAMHDLLHALKELHKAGFTHRDLQWPNCIRVNVKSEWKWVLIDLEYGGRDGAEWEGDGLVNWDAETLEVHDGKKVYTKRSDMYEFWKLIVQCLDSHNVTDIEMRTWVEEMQEKRAGAAQTLKKFCRKNCARCAKFSGLTER